MKLSAACVVAVDVGSVRTGSFAWAAVDMPGHTLTAHGDDPAGAAGALSAALTDGASAVLALEAPMSVPVPGDWKLLGKGRTGEGNRAWSASAGAGALATGLAQGAWLLAEIARALPGLAATTQVSRWRGAADGGGAPLLLVEAFVSGEGKPVPTALGPHAADAEAAARAVAERLAGEDGADGTDMTCAPQRAFSLLAAQAHWAGLAVAGDELALDVLVVRARPAG
ncbi:hypothetical protein K6168_34655 [Streptomyces sp. FB2]|uniref:hypothetical protein n=1 Tax=Streptomyces sp. FB2 TaxID=2902454 RepID=UPI001F38BEA0|nr:hypothetical protein [Streptomyces sp. FB2]MCF2540775.1 hypothetical protein [Streptomyces sp. FB2]